MNGGNRVRPLAGLALAVAALTLSPGVAGGAPPHGGSPAPGAATAPQRPTAKTGPATAITFQAASLTGTVDPGGQATTYFFQYGPTTHYGSESPPSSPAVGRTTVTSTVTGLAPQTTYHYRLVAINELGTSFAGDATFTTSAAPVSLGISALPNPVPLGSHLTVLGTLTGAGAATSVVVLQAKPFPFSGGFQILGSPAATTPTGAFQFEVPALTVTTQFRVVGIGPGEPVVSSTVTEFVQLAVTMTVGARAGQADPSRMFSGLISPAQTGARVSVQRLVHGRWVLLAATTARPTTAGISGFALPIRIRHSGLYRAYASTAEGGHVAGWSLPTVVHASG